MSGHPPLRVGALYARAPACLAALALLAACHGDALPARSPLVVSAPSLTTSEGGDAGSFELVLRSRPTAPVEVEIRSDDPGEGLVLAPGYAAPSVAQELTFTPEDWDQPRRIAVHPVDDVVSDGDVTYPVRMRVAFSEDDAYADASPAVMMVTNVDDDVRGFTVSAHELTTSEAGPTSAVFTVRLNAQPAGTIWIPVASADPSEGLLSSAFYGDAPTIWLTFANWNWNMPQTVTVRGQSDPIADGDVSYAVVVGPPGGDPLWAAVPAQQLRVTNLGAP
jgi:hypothetical protein